LPARQETRIGRRRRRRNAAAVAFYEKYGFLKLPKAPNRLFLPMATIEELF